MEEKGKKAFRAVAICLRSFGRKRVHRGEVVLYGMNHLFKMWSSNANFRPTPAPWHASEQIDDYNECASAEEERSVPTSKPAWLVDIMPYDILLMISDASGIESYLPLRLTWKRMAVCLPKSIHRIYAEDLATISTERRVFCAIHSRIKPRSTPTRFPIYLKQAKIAWHYARLQSLESSQLRRPASRLTCLICYHSRSSSGFLKHHRNGFNLEDPMLCVAWSMHIDCAAKFKLRWGLFACKDCVQQYARYPYEETFSKLGLYHEYRCFALPRPAAAQRPGLRPEDPLPAANMETLARPEAEICHECEDMWLDSLRKQTWVDKDAVPRPMRQLRWRHDVGFFYKNVWKRRNPAPTYVLVQGPVSLEPRGPFSVKQLRCGEDVRWEKDYWFDSLFSKKDGGTRMAPEDQLFPRLSEQIIKPTHLL